MSAKDSLDPIDGFTDASIQYAGFDAIAGGSAAHRFDIRDEKGDLVGTFEIETPPNNAGSIDLMVVQAHEGMVKVLRQWLHTTDELRRVHEKRVASLNLPAR